MRNFICIETDLRLIQTRLLQTVNEFAVRIPVTDETDLLPYSILFDTMSMYCINGTVLIRQINVYFLR